MGIDALPEGRPIHPWRLLLYGNTSGHSVASAQDRRGLSRIGGMATAADGTLPSEALAGANPGEHWFITASTADS